MSIKYTCEISSMGEFPAWSGGKQNLEKVIEKGRIDELDSLVQEIYPIDYTPTETELNDLLWFGLDEIDEFKNLWNDNNDSGAAKIEAMAELLKLCLKYSEGSPIKILSSEATEGKVTSEADIPEASKLIMEIDDELGISCKDKHIWFLVYGGNDDLEELVVDYSANDLCETIHKEWLDSLPRNESVKEDAPAQGSAEDEIKQWRIPNPLGIDTIFVGTKKAAEEYGKKYGFTPEEVQ